IMKKVIFLLFILATAEAVNVEDLFQSSLQYLKELALGVVAQAQGNDVNCPNGAGNYTSPTSCNRYYKCSYWNGELTSTEETCPEGTYFSNGFCTLGSCT
ncbi:unnamed protein product, partial [Allacma fusca]